MIPLALWSCSLLRLRQTTDYSYPAVRSLAPVQDRLQAADAAAPNVLLTDVGQVSTPGFAALFWRVVYRPFLPDLKRVLVIAGVNGNGAAGVEYTLGLVQELASPPGPATLYDADILPLANPWGWVHGVGPSEKGVDIEWDFANFASHESRIIKRFLREKRYDLVIDLREDPEATGFYIWQYGLDSTAASERIVGDLRAKGYPIEADIRRLLLKPRNGIIAAPMWGLTLMRFFDRLTLSGYIRQNTSYVVYSVVTPTVLPLADRVAMQRIAVETLISEYLVAPGPPPPARPGL
ncbi:MAG: hypothetical protein HY895_10695 [Deltaproteobacteria bacterium]|nr:hypothetical protein [Deltaproteobacteria bacterium]